MVVYTHWLLFTLSYSCNVFNNLSIAGNLTSSKTSFSDFITDSRRIAGMGVSMPLKVGGAISLKLEANYIQRFNAKDYDVEGAAYGVSFGGAF